MGNVTKLAPGIGHVFVLPESGVGSNGLLLESCWQGREVFAAIGFNTVIYLNGFIPVVGIGPGCPCAIARPLGRIFLKLTISQRVGLASKWLIAVIGG